MLELKNVSYFRDNKQILDNISLKIDNNYKIEIEFLWQPFCPLV